MRCINSIKHLCHSYNNTSVISACILIDLSWLELKRIPYSLAYYRLRLDFVGANVKWSIYLCMRIHIPPTLCITKWRFFKSYWFFSKTTNWIHLKSSPGVHFIILMSVREASSSVDKKSRSNAISLRVFALSSRCDGKRKEKEICKVALVCQSKCNIVFNAYSHFLSLPSF